MKQEQAKAMVMAIETLSSAFGSNIKATWELRTFSTDVDEDNEVFIYSEAESELNYLRIHAIALAMEEAYALPSFHCTYKEHKAFRLW